jgi:hypothetical protein
VDEASKNDPNLDAMLVNIGYERDNKESYLDQFLSIPKQLEPLPLGVGFVRNG